MASALSAAACVITSLPFDMIKTRLQNMKPGADGAMPYRGVADCAVKIARVEGPLAFYTGACAAAAARVSGARAPRRPPTVPPLAPTPQASSRTTAARRRTP